MNKGSNSNTASENDGTGGSGTNKLRIGDEVLRHLKQQHPIDIRNLEIENQPSRQRRRLIARQLMKKFKKGKEK